MHFQRVNEGKYRMGAKVYYVRKFRSHIMVRVGGGWLTLDEFLERHDPCYKYRKAKINMTSKSSCGSVSEALAKRTLPYV
ncbi:1,3-beta-glucanosyltransferase [Cichlidogyrus casuarinus]|uniref:1,3-beta-glucanosyltransferase n=1 Tax=Cichlidogyrus casuarinus TaxID=1844966 RepID=A0ABD2PV00_9PLAT